MVITSSRHSTDETADRLAAAAQERGLRVFARFDHGAAARAAGLSFHDEQVVVFGDPRAGTLLMEDDPLVGIELPLRVLVWDEDGMTSVGYLDPRELAAEYELSAHLDVLETMAALLETLVAESTA